MRAELDAVAFDIDGTLYPDFSLFARLLPFTLSHLNLMVNFGRVRDEIRDWQAAHPGEINADFFSYQALLLSSKIGETPGRAAELLRTLIYEGWRPVFERVRPFPYLHETFDAFRASGLKLGLLSDFLPSQKGDVWGLAPKCDVVLGSEETGALKPSPIPFLSLAESLGVPPARVLYVGNSVSSDVRGASAAGMKTACVIGRVAALLGRKAPGADISFHSYRQLRGIVLK